MGLEGKVAVVTGGKRRRRDAHTSVVGHLRAARPGETPEQTRQPGNQAFMDLLASPFSHVPACAAVEEMLSALHERLVVGSPP